RVKASGTICQAAGADSTCDPADTCDGTSKICASNFASSGTACNDGNACTTPDTCNGSGMCVSTTVVPAITSVIGPGPLPLGSTATLTAYFSAPAGCDVTCMFSWDDGSSNTSVNPSGTGNGSFTASPPLTSLNPGVYAVTVTVTDSNNSTSAPTIQYVIIYDPNAGFVTGGGWINSQAGSYRADTNLTGKANFGFVSKYKKGAS